MSKQEHHKQHDYTNLNFRFDNYIRENKINYLDKNETSIKLLISTIVMIFQMVVTCLGQIGFLFMNNILDNQVFTDYLDHLIQRYIKFSHYIYYANKKFKLIESFNCLPKLANQCIELEDKIKKSYYKNLVLYMNQQDKELDQDENNSD